MSTLYIGFGHRSGHGKDLAANFLLNALYKKTHCRVKILSFATKLKQIAESMYGWAGLRGEEYYNEHRDERNIKLKPLGLTPVEIWVLIGEKFRDIYPPTWLDYVVQSDHGYDVVITPDVRHINEVKGIKETGGEVCKILNPRVPKREGISIDDKLEAYKKWDRTFLNNKDKEHLQHLMDNYADLLILKYNLRKTS